MSPRVNPSGTQPTAHAAETTRPHSAPAGKAPKPQAPAAHAAPTSKQAAAALRHVTAAAANKNAAHAQPVSAADQKDLQHSIRAAHYGGGRAEATSAARSNKSAGVSITRAHGRVVLDAGRGRDDIEVSRKKHGGGLVVKVNGKSHDFNAADAARLIIRGGGGDDRIFVREGVRTNLTLEGGKGNDRIIGGDGADRIRGGAGRDYINGSRGNDTLSGGGAYDVIYGGYNNDRISGGGGNDYCEGGTGRDSIDGGRGRDILSGGRGNDTLRGSAGDDHLYAGLGRDRLYGSAGNDEIYAQRGSDRVRGGAGDNHVYNRAVRTGLGHSIKVGDENDSDRFKERVNADLDFLRSSKVGQKMLRALDRAAEKGNTVTIEENAPKDGDKATAESKGIFRDPRTGKAGDGNDATIHYVPSSIKVSAADRNAKWTDFPPAVALYHEMAHAYNYVTGTTQDGIYKGPGQDAPVKGHPEADIANAERQAVGLKIDHDNDDNQRTRMRTINPPALTENGLREELGLPHRRTYS